MKIKLYQEGGAVAPQGGEQGGAPMGAEQGGAPGAEQGAPEGGEQGGQDPLMQIAQMFAQALQSQDCKALAQGAQMFLQLISQAQQQGQGGEGAPPQEAAVMKKGGKFVLIKKGDKGKSPVKGGKNDKVDISKCGGKAKK